jgi:hypothetical protein
MKLRALLLAVFVSASAVALRAAEPLPAFNAIMTMGKDNRFVLISADAKTSGWLKLGETFAGVKLKGYDAATGGLDLDRDGKVTRVFIDAAAAIKDSGPVALPSTRATLADAEAMLKAMHFDEMFSKMMDQQKKSFGPMMDRMMAGMKLPEEDKEKVLAIQRKVMNEFLDSMSGPEMKASIADIYSNVFSKEELAGMSAFYSTPVGQSMVAKQPQAQEKMMQVMMPKMAQIGTKMQEAMKDYAAQKQAAAAGTPPSPAPAPKP